MMYNNYGGEQKKKSIIESVSKFYGTTPEIVEAEMQMSINAAWTQPESKEIRHRLFPEGQPTPDLFIKRIAELIHQDMSDIHPKI